MQKIRWGIIGTGRMAATIAAEIAAMRPQDVELTAISSRDGARARAFAERFRIRRAVDDPSVFLSEPLDVVYIATPHTLHGAQMLACLRAGRAVLVEKPFTLNAAQARAVLETAAAAKVFAMEAMWTRFLPSMVALRELVAAGTIGRVRMIIGGGAFVPDGNAPSYLLDPALGGGALLDAGVYLVSLASMILGTPSGVLASGQLGQTGVDEQDAIVLTHANGAQALLYVSLGARRSPDLEILGEHGRIRVAAPVFRPSRLILTSQDGSETIRDFPVEGSGYGYQIRAVCQALRAGEIESPVMPLAESLAIMQTLDEIRRQIGLRYPAEHA